MIPVAKGTIAKDQTGQLVLVNPEGKAFAIDHDISTIWAMLDGQRDYDSLIDELCRNARYSREEIDHAVKEALKKLESVNLIAWN